jgi:hypothetical protein
MAQVSIRPPEEARPPAARTATNPVPALPE